MIPRWMPFSIPIYIDPIKSLFERIKGYRKGSATLDEDNEDPLLFVQ